MAKRLLFSLLVAAAAYGQLAHGATYSSPTYSYSVEIPDGWRQLPDDVLQAMVGDAVKFADNPTTFDAGFIPGNARSEFPRIMFGVILYQKLGMNRQITEAEIRKLASQITGLSASELADITTRRMPKAVADSMEIQSSGGATLDMPNHRLLWSVETELSGQPCTGYCVMLFGRESCVTAGYWYKKNESEGDKSLQAALANTLTFDSGHAFTTAWTPGQHYEISKPKESLWEKFVVGALTALFILAISFAARRLGWMRRRRDPPQATTPPPSASAVCGNCGGRFKAPVEAIGKRTKCPKCGTAMEVQAKA